jgi:hypothetical protein
MGKKEDAAKMTHIQDRFTPRGKGPLTPVPRPVPDVKDFSGIVLKPVHDNVGRANQFHACLASPRVCRCWEGKLCDAIEDGFRKGAGGFGVCPRGRV